ncbi:MAG: indolepyruvate ferredoxin oxidoreductase subunit alpha [Acutalibacteraceae bacterium]|nr:indolepyruvate ferredoxin oxidoreductase subunit alpha [Acutalibacteraceae bacterium]
MKKLMLGNEAVARGFLEAGCSVVSSYPGTPSTEITEYAAKYDEIYCEWAPNEKVACEVAFGASLGGARSACCMKHVGLNVAADPLFTMSYTGVNGGLVICVADDPGMHSSQNEQDSRHYAIASKIPMLEPSDSREAKEFAKIAFTLSEQFDTPVLLRMCTRIAHSQCSVELCEPQAAVKKEYVKNPQKYIMAPANAIRRHPVVEERTAKLISFAETTTLNRVEWAEDKKLGIITSGTCYDYVKEVMGDSVSVMKLGLVNPLPVDIIKDFVSKVERVIVIEELDPVIENHCKALGIAVEGKSLLPICGEFSQKIIADALGVKGKEFAAGLDNIPVRPPVMCSGCPHRGLFYVLSKNKLTVLGDIGCYTLGSAAPLTAIDSVLCMGASVSGVHGFNKARGNESENKTVCVIGDSTFMHSGMTGLANIAYNGTNSTVIIVDNSITGMTGHQQNPTTGYNIKGDPATKIDLEALCKALGINRVRVVDPYDLKATEAAVKEEIAVNEPSVIISRRPCALLKYVKAKPALKIDSEKCRSCKACMRIGCPAISMKDGKAVIDATQCVGCGVCEQLCAFGAIGGDM